MAQVILVRSPRMSGQEQACDIVYRHALDVDETGNLLAFGDSKLTRIIEILGMSRPSAYCPLSAVEDALTRRPGFATTASLALAVVLAACGNILGIHDLGLGGSPAATTTSSESSAGSGGGGGQGGASSGGGQGGEAGATTGDSTAASTGATAAASTSSGGPIPTVFCNNASCAPGEICCFNTSQQTDHCGQTGACGGGFIELRCNDPGDCPGSICCADVDLQKNPPYKSISCQPTCNDPQTTIVVCSDAAPTCPSAKQCTQSMVLGQGYKLCK